MCKKSQQLAPKRAFLEAFSWNYWIINTHWNQIYKLQQLVLQTLIESASLPDLKVVLFALVAVGMLFARFGH